jgi:hypothetical protein
MPLGLFWRVSSIFDRLLQLWGRCFDDRPDSWQRGCLKQSAAHVVETKTEVASELAGAAV